MTRIEAEDLVRANNGGSILPNDVYGPFDINGLCVWEIWVEVSGGYNTRFPVKDKSNGERIYFSSFAEFADLCKEKQNAQIQVIENKYKKELLNLEVEFNKLKDKLADTSNETENGKNTLVHLPPNQETEFTIESIKKHPVVVAATLLTIGLSIGWGVAWKLWIDPKNDRITALERQITVNNEKVMSSLSNQNAVEVKSGAEERGQKQ